jgi:hypothetical protein
MTNQIATPDTTDSLSADVHHLNSIEDKIGKCLELMQAALVYKAPQFKDYWEVKKQCLPLFKEEISPPSRSALWEKYIAISEEARHLKKILDEQSSFAVEQIDLAIQAVESEVKRYQEGTKGEWTLPDECQFIEAKKETYEAVQQELNFLNHLATRLNGLRKELIHTEMRIRYKNKFFGRLSVAGDTIFPKRKELVKQISGMFVADVAEFFAYVNSENERQKHPLFELREEIKAFQLLAKELTLDTHSFKETRHQLTTCWDFLKGLDQERKKEEVVKPIVEIKEKGVFDAEKQRRDKIEEFKKRLGVAKAQVDETAMEQLLLVKNEFGQELALLVTTQAEKELLEHDIKELRDLIHEKKEKALASLSDEERNSLCHLQEQLKDWKVQKQEIRGQLEAYRSALAGSGFDFEKAIQYRKLFDAEKMRLEKVCNAIEDIEDKIEELEG